MQAVRVILVVVCLAGVASAASWTSKVCEECKVSAKEVKKNLPKIEESVIAQCKKIEIQAAQDRCIEGVKAFIKKLSRETPEETCQALHLCSRKVPSFLGRPEQLMSSALCEPCKHLAQMIKAGVVQAKDQIRGMCKNCGAPENVKKCEQAIDSFIQQVNEKSPQELCAEIGFCAKQ